MWNRSDKLLDDCIVQALKPETQPSAALKQEIWDGLLAKVTAQAATHATSTAESELAEPLVISQPAPVFNFASPCKPREPLATRLLLSAFDLLEASSLFLFSDNASLERARIHPAPMSRLLIRGTFSYAGV